MRTLYTLVITIVFCFSLFAVYNVGYERGKNKQTWENFHEQNKRDSINKIYYHNQKIEIGMWMYKNGYTWGVMEHSAYGWSAWEKFKKDSISARRLLR